MPLVATYALLAASAAALVGGLWLGGGAARRRFARLSRYAGVMQIGALVAAYLVLRPGAGDDGRADIETAEEAEKPIFIELYSNF